MPRPSARTHVLDTALDLLGQGGTVTLDSVAAAAGLTKPGLIYHFATKEALMDALLDHRLAQYAADLERLVGGPSAAAAAPARFLGYLQWSLSGTFDAADLVMTADPRLRDRLTARWADHLDPWLRVPAGTPAGTRTRLLAVRFMADGAWFDQACGVVDLAPAEQRRLLLLAHDLLDVPA